MADVPSNMELATFMGVTYHRHNRDGQSVPLTLLPSLDPALPQAGADWICSELCPDVYCGIAIYDEMTVWINLN